MEKTKFIRVESFSPDLMKKNGDLVVPGERSNKNCRSTEKMTRGSYTRWSFGLGVARDGVAWHRNSPELAKRGKNSLARFEGEWECGREGERLSSGGSPAASSLLPNRDVDAESTGASKQRAGRRGLLAATMNHDIYPDLSLC